MGKYPKTKGLNMGKNAEKSHFGTKVGKILKETRRRHGLSVAELSKATNIGVTTINRAENGDGNIVLERAMRLLRELDIPMSEVESAYRD